MIILILLSGIIFISANYFRDKKISSRVIKNLSDTKKIVIKDKNNNILGTITEENVIAEILSLMSEATGKMNGVFTCEGTDIYFEMYNAKKLIDSVDVWINGNIMPRSIHKGCAKYSLPRENKTDLKIIIEEQTGTKFFRIYDYSEDCDQTLELIYENEEYKYYFPCIKSDKVFIEFITKNLKMTVIEALEDNYINIDELIRKSPNLFYIEIK